MAKGQKTQKAKATKAFAASATAEPEKFSAPRKSSKPSTGTAVSSSSASPPEMPKSKIENLPREILLDIMGYVLPTGESINVTSALVKSQARQADTWDADSTKLSRRREQDKRPAAILRVCREFNICGADLLWGKNTFVFDDMRDLNNFARKASLETKATIRNLSIGKGYHTSRRGVPHEQWPPAMNKLAEFPKLQDLTLWVGWVKPATLEQISMGYFHKDEHYIPTQSAKWAVWKEAVVPFGSQGVQDEVSLRLPKRFLDVVDTIRKEQGLEKREDVNGSVLEHVTNFWLQQIPMPVLQRLKSLKTKELVCEYPLRWKEGATESLEDVMQLCEKPEVSLQEVGQQSSAIALC